MVKEKLVIVAILFASMQTGFTQEWYPKGATWYFNKQEQLSSPAHGYIRYKVQKDTMIGGMQAKIVTGKTFLYNGSVKERDTMYVYEEDSRVYYWAGSHYELMYNFNRKKDDTLKIAVEKAECDSVSPIKVDSTNTIYQDNMELTVQYVSYTMQSTMGENITISNKLTERIGSEKNFIYSPTCQIMDEFTYSGLRCYSDTEITYKNKWWKNHYPGASCDTLINQTTGIIDNKNRLAIFPNPTDGHFRVKLGKNASAVKTLEVHTIYGRKIQVYDKIQNNMKLDLSTYPNGIYILSVHLKTGRKKKVKIVKHK